MLINGSGTSNAMMRPQMVLMKYIQEKRVLVVMIESMVHYLYSMSCWDAAMPSGSAAMKSWWTECSTSKDSKLVWVYFELSSSSINISTKVAHHLNSKAFFVLIYPRTSYSDQVYYVKPTLNTFCKTTGIQTVEINRKLKMVTVRVIFVISNSRENHPLL